MTRLRRALVAAALALTSIAASPARADAATWHTRTSQEGSYAWAVFHLIDRERAAHGLQPLWHCSMLRTSARRHDEHMAAADTLDHQLPGEPVFTRRMLNAGYRWVWAGENIAWNSDMSLAGALQLERLMYHHAEHRANILGSHYRAVGVDVWLDAVNGRLWMTVDFGRRY